MNDLARLSYLDPKTVWPHEAHDFTPWLLENEDVLADALGIELDLTIAEHAIGTFSLDLLGRDLTHDAALIVENQLAATDHSHLGQILTYAAGTDAKTIIWVATSFREEHRQALDWLNQNSGPDVRFFGVIPRVVTITGSERAPLFELVAKPNDWQKDVRASGPAASPAGGKSLLYADFWQRFVERVRLVHPEWTKSQKPGGFNWFDMRSRIKGATLISSFAQGGRLRHEIYINSGDPDRNTEIFDGLLEERAALEATYGRPLGFERLEGRQACRIADYAAFPANVTMDAEHEQYIDWLIDAGERMRKALQAIPLP